LGVASAAVCGALAYHWTAKPVYTSEGLIRIAYTVPTGGVESEQNALPNFEAFMQQQKTVIASQNLAEMAAKDPVAWKSTPAGVGPTDPQAYFSKHLSVSQAPKTELIKVTVQDEDARTAAAGVTAIVNAYGMFYNSQDKESDEKAMAYWEKNRQQLQTDVANLRREIQDKAKAFGTTQLEETRKDLQTKRSRIESALNDLQITIAEMPSPADRNPSAPSRLSQVRPGEMTLDQIAAVDAVTRFHIEEAERAQAEVDRLTRYGYGRSHRLMVAALRGVEEAQARAQQSAETYRKNHPATSTPTTEQITIAGTPGQSVEEMKAREQRLKEMLAGVKSDQVALGNAAMELNGLEDRLKQKTDELQRVNSLLEKGETKGAIGGRLSVISRGDVPLKPSTDKRKQIAGAAGFMGFFLPALAVMAISLIRRRYRFSDEPGADPISSKIPLMGMLPNVPARATPQLRLAAAYAAHHLRVLLSSRATAVVKRTFLVTSAGEGEGKTTVTMALAISFAAAKHRTLVIDGDFVSRRLTRGFNAEQQEGLYESLGHGDLDGQWLNAASNLCVLPTGKADAADACGITAENVRLLLEQAIQHFDVVLIDTGSILGSPESAVLAREVDGVIMTISRGQQQGQVKKAILRLEALGATVVGRIFNRSNMSDFQSSYVTPTAGWQEPGNTGSGEPSELQQRVANFGPLVRAVAEAVPSEEPGAAAPRIGSSEHVTRT
jgi:capsular exopolysaccharide synthesis family protein